MKKVQKTLTGAMAAMMATGVVATPAMAETNTTDVDALYKAAYTATEKALNEKTQAAINEARKAIDALPKDLDWAIGEFSKQVDTVQHPILVDIIKAIETAQASKSQADINAAKKAIPSDLFDIWKNSYSSAVDKIQQELQKQALDAIEVAKASRKAEDIEAAKALVADILTSDDAGMVAWAKLLEEDINTVKPYDVVVTKVDSITTTGVKVSFDALKDALKDVTVEVIDNKGNLVEVEAISSLIEEEVEATFKFTNILKDDPTGVWTVNGVKIDLTEINNVKKVREESNSDNLLKLLKSIKITGLVDGNKDAYLEADRSELETYEDVQELVDKVNEDVAKANDVTYVIKAASGTTTQFKNALATLELDKVNSDWIKEYKAELSNGNYKNVTEVSKIQEAIYSVNKYILTTNAEKAKEVDADKREVEINEVISLAKEYYKDDAKDENSKETFLNDLNEVLAITKVNTASSLATLKSALINLEKVINNKTTFEYSRDVNESMLKAYFEGYNGKPSVRTLGNKSQIKDMLNDIQTEVIKEKLSTVDKVLVAPAKDGKYSTEEKAAITNSLKELVAATSNKTGDDKFVMDKVVEANYERYSELKASITSVSDLKTLIENGNKEPLKTAVEKVATATTADELLNALKNTTLGLTNVLDANKEAYKDEAFTLDKDATDIKEEVKKAQNLVNAVNAAQVVLTSNNIDEVSNAILSFAVSTGNSDVINLSTLVRKDVAEDVKASIKNKESLKIEDLTSEIAKAKNTQSTNVGAVNNAMDNVSMVAALNNVSSEFKNLSEVEKITVAEKFIAKFPTHKDADGKVVRTNFVNYTEIRTLLAECMK